VYQTLNSLARFSGPPTLMYTTPQIPPQLHPPNSSQPPSPHGCSFDPLMPSAGSDSSNSLVFAVFETRHKVSLHMQSSHRGRESGP
jgi:hypothetical protein